MNIYNKCKPWPLYISPFINISEIHNMLIANGFSIVDISDSLNQYMQEESTNDYDVLWEISCGFEQLKMGIYLVENEKGRNTEITLEEYQNTSSKIPAFLCLDCCIERVFLASNLKGFNNEELTSPESMFVIHSDNISNLLNILDDYNIKYEILKNAHNCFYSLSCHEKDIQFWIFTGPTLLSSQNSELCFISFVKQKGGVCNSFFKKNDSKLKGSNFENVINYYKSLQV